MTTPTARRTAAAALLAAAVLPFAAGAAVGGAPPGPDRTTALEARRVDRVDLRLTWSDCSERATGGVRAECAVARLPLDYDEPGGPKVGVAVLRIRATDPARRIGTLFVNPGGPGVPGTDAAADSPRWLGASVRARFDVVGFDPRGVGRSDRVRCWRSAAEQREDLGAFDLGVTVPRTPAQIAALTAATSNVARACSTTGQPLAGAASTTEAARDLDVLRRTLGDRKLTYYGESYGTFLGNVYANLFPDRVRALALDGVVDPLAWVGTPATRNVPQSLRGDADVQAHRALAELLDRCRAAGPARCRFAAAGDPRRTYRAVLDSLRRAPVQLGEGDEGELLDADALVDRLFGQLFASTADELVDGTLTAVWAALHPAPGAARAATSPTATAPRPAGSTSAGEPAGPSAGTPADEDVEPPADMGEGSLVVMCTDGYHPARLAAWPAHAAAAERRAPVIGPYLVWGSAPCAGDVWTARDEDAHLGPFDRRTAAPVLVVGSVRDPSTSYQAAVSVSEQLPGARLLSADNWGHVSYGKSRCVAAAVDAYLLAGALPPEGTVCPGDRTAFGGPAPARPSGGS